MDRAALRLELLRIAHHHQQSTEVTLTIAKRYEEGYFADLVLDGEASAKSDNAKPAKAKT